MSVCISATHISIFVQYSLLQESLLSYAIFTAKLQRAFPRYISPRGTSPPPSSSLLTRYIDTAAAHHWIWMTFFEQWKVYKKNGAREEKWQCAGKNIWSADLEFSFISPNHPAAARHVYIDRIIVARRSRAKKKRNDDNRRGLDVYVCILFYRRRFEISLEWVMAHTKKRRLSLPELRSRCSYTSCVCCAQIYIAYTHHYI